MDEPATWKGARAEGRFSYWNRPQTTEKSRFEKINASKRQLFYWRLRAFTGILLAFAGAELALWLSSASDRGRRSARMAGLRMGIDAVLALAFAVAAAKAGEVTLGAAAGRSGRYFGAALDPGALDEKPYRVLAAAELTSVTPENAMKWEEVEPARGEFHWDEADALVAFAHAHGQKVRGHTLVWHSQLPPWLTQGQFSHKELRELMVAHIAAEAGRYEARSMPGTWSTSRSPTTGN